jgi:hypothetical protein
MYFDPEVVTYKRLNVIYYISIYYAAIVCKLLAIMRNLWL